MGRSTTEGWLGRSGANGIVSLLSSLLAHHVVQYPETAAQFLDDVRSKVLERAPFKACRPVGRDFVAALRTSDMGLHGAFGQ